MTRLDELLDAYDRDHQHPANRALHLLGITLIGTGVATLPFVPPLGLGEIALGWGAQFLGHAIEGKPPSFTRDPKFMAVGALWYVRTLRGLLTRTPRARAA